MTEAVEETQRRIEQAEAQYKNRLYQRDLKNFKIFPKFLLDTK